MILCLLLGVGLRCAGLMRGSIDQPPIGQPEFYSFHPDEATLVRAAVKPIDPFDPPFTAYGLLPVYALRGALWIQGLAAADLDLVDERRRVFVTGRLLAVLLSSLVLVMTWVLGRRMYARDTRSQTSFCNDKQSDGWGPALLGLAFVCFAPGAIQQAHFFIVDGFFTAFALAGLLAIVQATQSGQRSWYVLAGLLIGALGAVRFNGLALGLVLLAGHLLRPGDSVFRRLRSIELWLAGGIALATIIVLQPYLLFNLSLLERTDTHADFALSLSFARLEFLQPWTLVDVHGIRYWDHWFGLWPWVCGWPLTLAMLMGTVYVIIRGNFAQRLVLLWCGLYFFSVGALPTKAVRYIVPLLPLLGLCTGVACAVLWRRWRLVGGILISVLVGSVIVYGLAFSRIYIEEDSRIQANRWIAATVPKDSRIGIETGAFNLRLLVNPAVYQQKPLDVSGLFYGSAYMLCGHQVDYLSERLLQMDWLVLAEENRAVQFRAVPELFPVVNAFYTRLLAGELGFEPIWRAAVEPELFGVRVNTRGAEPSFLAYDHPTVHIFRRKRENAEKMLAVWRKEISATAECADGALKDVAEALQRGANAEALEMAVQLQARYPHAALVHLLVAKAYWQQGDETSAEAAYQLYLPEQAQGKLRYLQRSPLKHYIPGNAALAAVEWGLGDLAIRTLRRGIGEVKPIGDNAALAMAESYIIVGRALMRRGQLQFMEEALTLSLAIHPHKAAHNVLAAAAYERGDYERAVVQWQQSLLLDDLQGDTHAALGQVLLAKHNAPQEALLHLQRALQLDPSRIIELEAWVAAARSELAPEH
jgi:tetratricopeptide (TPR) repeat protein